MIMYQETTNWKHSSADLNHCYVFAGAVSEKLLAHCRSGNSNIIWLDKPMKFNKRGRTFKKLGEVERYEVPNKTCAD